MPPKRDAITYADGMTPVLPGDRVSVRLFLRRRSGEVIYVPGISKRRSTYDHNGLTWVGVSLPDGWAIGEIVLPDTGMLKPSVRFLGRGTESLAAAEAMERLDAQEVAEAFDRTETDEQPRAAPIGTRPPTARDWLAGLVAIIIRLGLYGLVLASIIALIRILRKAL